MLRWLLCLVALVVIAGAISAMAYLANPDPGRRYLASWFMLNHEGNPPTFFSYGLLVFAAVLCAAAARKSIVSRDGWRRYWIVLAAVFLFMGYDEAGQAHERLGPVAERFVSATGVLYFSWIVIVAPFVVLFGLAYVRFLLALPRSVAFLMVAAGAVFVGGAIGMEMVGGAVAEIRGMNSVPYQIAAGIEEAMEMLGVTLFCYAVLRYLARADGRVHL